MHRQLVLITALTAPAFAGDNQSAPNVLAFRGEAAEWPAGVLVNNGASSNSILIKAPTDQTSGGVTTPPAPSVSGSGAGDPRFALTTLMSIYDNDPRIPSIEIDALSSGNAQIAGANGGVPSAGSAWLAVTAGVSADSSGEPGSYFERSKAFFGDPGSDVVGYYFSQSTLLNPALPGNAVLEANRLHMGIAPGTGGDLTALDYGIGLHEFNVALPAGATFPVSNYVFFSVTSSWAAAAKQVNPQLGFAHEFDLAGNYLGRRTPNGTDIYMMGWLPDAHGAYDWRGPFMWASGDDLGFVRGDASADLDALDVDPSGHVVYSPRRGSPMTIPSVDVSQLMIAHLDQGHLNTGLGIVVRRGSSMNVEPPTALRDNVAGGSPVKVTTKIGVGDVIPPAEDGDEVDLVCTFDPHTTIAPVYVAVARPQPPGAAVQEPMGMSMSRRDDDAQGKRHWDVQVNGWGDATPSKPGTLRIWEYDGPLSSAPAQGFPAGWTLIQQLPRTASDNAVHFKYRPLIPFPDMAGPRSLMATFHPNDVRKTVFSWPCEFDHL